MSRRTSADWAALDSATNSGAFVGYLDAAHGMTPYRRTRRSLSGCCSCGPAIVSLMSAAARATTLGRWRGLSGPTDSSSP